MAPHGVLQGGAPLSVRQHQEQWRVMDSLPSCGSNTAKKTELRGSTAVDARRVCSRRTAAELLKRGQAEVEAAPPTEIFENAARRAALPTFLARCSSPLVCFLKLKYFQKGSGGFFSFLPALCICFLF